MSVYDSRFYSASRFQVSSKGTLMKDFSFFHTLLLSDFLRLPVCDERRLHSQTIRLLIIYMKKLLDSDWLRAVQFRGNTSAKSVTPVQITNRRGRKQRPGFSLGKQQ